MLYSAPARCCVAAKLTLDDIILGQASDNVPTDSRTSRQLTVCLRQVLQGATLVVPTTTRHWNPWKREPRFLFAATSIACVSHNPPRGMQICAMDQTDRDSSLRLS